MKRWFTILMLFSATAAMATVDLTLFNSFPLLNNSSVPLAGISTGGDLVQLILVGPNGVIDPPSLTGGAGGDDTILFTTHIGVGLTSTNSGRLVQSSIIYPDLFGGNSNAFVRFWDSNTAAHASFYGASGLFTLPAGDGFGLAEFDFAPSASFSANTPFGGGGGGMSAVPEPSNLFILGMFVMGGWALRRRRQTGHWGTLALGLLMLTGVARAQISLPLDVTASRSIQDENGNSLPGDNPVNGAGNRALVQILQVGDNGIAHLPDLNGNPTSNDQVVAQTVIGQGIPPQLASSGRLSTSIYALPATADGHRLYARVFNATSVAAATHWMQSATFVVTNSMVMDLSALGVAATTLPKASDPTTTDSDGDGQTDYQEFLANTNPQDANDRLDVSGFVGANVSVAGRAGRAYILQRTTNDLSAIDWQPVGNSVGPLNTDQNLVLSDPNPPTTPKAFYRIRVIMP